MTSYTALRATANVAEEMRLGNRSWDQSVWTAFQSSVHPQTILHMLDRMEALEKALVDVQGPLVRLCSGVSSVTSDMVREKLLPRLAALSDTEHSVTRTSP